MFDDPNVVLHCEKIDKIYPGTKALDQVSFDLLKGQVNVLIGENGAGKSTLMKMIAGIEQPSSGKMYMDGKEVYFKDTNAARAKGIGIIHQELSLFPNMTVYQNIFMGHEKKKGIFLDDKAHSEGAKKILKRLEHEIPPDTMVGDLRVGQQQMVEIARNLNQDDLRVLIMDEPTSSLTAKEIDDLFRIIRKLRDEGRGIVYISHRLEELAHIVDRVTIMRDGQYITDGNFKDMDMDYIIKNMVGREIKEKFPRVECEKGKKIFEVKNLNAGKMVRDINFSLYEGEIVGFAGLMGAGRTETTRAIFGVDPKDGGELYVDGKKIEVNCPMDAIRNGVVLAPEDRKKDGLCTKLSIRQNLALPNLDLVCNKMGVINSGKEDALCEKAVKDLRIKTPNVEIDSGNLSGGNQQKVVVGKWLARDSRVVIFDEPTRGIDVGAKVEIYNLMNELKKQGIAVMFVSSEMPEVMGIADRIIVMCDGRITGEVSAREATQDEILTMATSFENKGIKETEGGSKNE